MTLGVLGGTFDPIHTGHVALATAAREAFGLETVLLVPSAVPPHRADPPQASSHHRFAMVALVAQLRPWLRASDLEVASALEGTSAAPSFTATTLRRLGESGYRPSQLFFITGADAFLEIATWREYPAVLDLAHFVVVSRPGSSLDAVPGALPDLAPRFRPASDGPGTDADRTPRVLLLAAKTPDISSTAVRARLAAGLPVDDLLPEAVARHARRHHLYGDTGRRPSGRPDRTAPSLQSHE